MNCFEESMIGGSQMHHEWSGFRQELSQYMTEHKIPETEFRFVNIYKWKNIYDKVLEHFIDGQYAKAHGLHWANVEDGFKKGLDRIYVFSYRKKDSYKWLERLPEIVKCEKVYLLLEAWNRQDHKYWIAECSPAVVDLVINDTYLSEDYYITDKKFNWLITGNHHDVVQMIGSGLDVGVIETICGEWV